MELTITRLVGVGGSNTALRLCGSIDLLTRKAVLYAGRSVLDGEDELTLDLAEVDFMDSVGIGALIELARAAELGGKRFAVVDCSPRVQRVLDATGLHDAWN